MRIIGACFVILTSAASCAPAGDAAAPAVKVERSQADNRLRVVIESDKLVDGRRPNLTLICEAGKPPELQLDLVRPSAGPPPLRGVFAQVQVKGGPEVTIELGWLEGATWQARLPHASQPESDSDDRENQRRLVPILYAFSRDRRLTVTPDAAHGPGERLVWSPETYAPQRAAVRDCAAAGEPPALPKL